MSDKITIQNMLQPGSTYRVDAGKFEAMKVAVLQVLPVEAPGLTPAELRERVLPLLPDDLFPGGEKAGWWLKAVQLDQEAKGTIGRSDKPPVRLRKL